MHDLWPDIALGLPRRTPGLLPCYPHCKQRYEAITDVPKALWNTRHLIYPLLAGIPEGRFKPLSLLSRLTVVFWWFWNSLTASELYSSVEFSVCTEISRTFSPRILGLNPFKDTSPAPSTATSSSLSWTLYPMFSSRSLLNMWYVQIM